VETQPYKLTPAEQALYDAVTGYFRDHFTRAAADRNRPVSLALMVLQRRLASSVAAITRSLERRADRLRALQAQPVEEWAADAPPDAEMDEDELDELDDADMERLEDQVATLTTARTRGELTREIAELDSLIKLAKAITTEAKWTALQEVLQRLQLADSTEKLLIFTEHKDTLDMLMGRLGHMGFAVTMIHGGMNMQDRLAAEQAFWHDAQLLVATEAAGEGINLQCAHLMINYDIPWNPTRLEQRMGRVHRYLQKKPVFIYNMVTRDTIEGEILDTLLEKLKLMKEAMGNDRVYDVVSQVLDLGQHSQADRIRDAILNPADRGAIAAEVSQTLDPSRRRQVEEIGLLALATRYMDMGRLEAERQESREQRLMPEYMERFFQEALSDVGGRTTRRRDGLWQVDPVPAVLRNPELPSVGYYGRPGDVYRYLTFQKAERNDPRFTNTPELIGPGHPLFEAILDLIDRRHSGTLDHGALFYDPEAIDPYLLWFVKLSVRDGRQQVVGTRMYAMRQSLTGGDAAGGFSKVAPAALIDLVPAAAGTVIPDALAAHLNPEARKPAIRWALDQILPDYFAEMSARRQHEVDQRRKYLESSLEHLRNQAQQRMFAAEGKAETDENYRIAFISARTRYDELTQRRAERRTQLAQEAQLIRQMPAVVTAVAVEPLPVETRERVDVLTRGGLEMHRDDEVERIAMEVAMAHERRRNWQVEDVSAEKIGFDVRSIHPDGSEAGVRCIEVKGRAGEGGVLLTSNEWIKAQRMGDDYWLYIVSNCRARPQLSIIRNPAARIRPEQLQEIIRYFVPPETWQALAEPVEGE
jgi:hypothetical protein